MNANTDAILLLTSRFSNGGAEGARPLTPTEWGRFAFWLREQGRSPADLLKGSLSESLAGWSDKTVTSARIKALLDRGHALALALEKWNRAGIWVLTRSDPAYPRRLKQHLKGSAPAILYGCGNQELLGASSIAVVGSRNASEQDLASAHALGGRIAYGGYAVVSGGARGVDEAAMLGALEAGGTAVGILADSLLRAATARKWRDGLLSGDLVLASPYHPEASFNTGNAMGRNKYVYGLSMAAIVVHSGTKGGTWTGAEENLKKSWVPLWVRKTEDPAAGNARLVDMGGGWLPEAVESIDVPSLHGGTAEDDPVDTGAATSSHVAEASTDQPAYESSVEHPAAEAEPVSAADGGDGQSGEGSAEPEVNGAAEQVMEPEQLSFYDFFLRKLQTQQQDFTGADLAESWGIPRKLLDEWLSRAVTDGVIVQSGKRPAKYRMASMDLIK